MKEKFMPAKDFYHDIVRGALEQEGWIITSDPYYFSVGEVDFFIDLGAEQLIAAERGVDKIAIEIKGFAESSPVHAFHEAVGKYINYRAALEENESDRVLYLAIPKLSYENFFQRPFVQKMIQLEKIKLIVYEPEKKAIIKWIQ
ncbi:MAG: XisH family protein [Bacteroidia bacterium]|nr:XisH family protein [Bacteroidia bacterium]